MDQNFQIGEKRAGRRERGRGGGALQKIDDTPN